MICNNCYTSDGRAADASNNVTLGLTFRPTPRLRHDLNYLRSSLRTRDGNPIFTNNIARATLNDHAARVRLIHDERVGADVLFTYQVGPSTAIDAGYTSGYQNLAPGEPGFASIRTGSPDSEVGRQGFVKLSYLWRQ